MMLCLCSKTYCCYDKKFDKMKLCTKGLNKIVLEESGDGPMEKYRKDLTSTNRGFRSFYHFFATYERTKKILSSFYLKRQVQDDEIHTKPWNL